jgi:protein-tyrosine phosphatase
MLSVLCVCLGNICRSPMAQGILQKVAIENGLEWRVDSAGTSGYHIGDLPDSRSIAMARHHGLDISGQRARRFSKDDFENFDLILVMDHDNMLDVLALAHNDSVAQKVKLFRHDQLDVQDPYYGGDRDFKLMYDVLMKHAHLWVKSIDSL